MPKGAALLYADANSPNPPPGVQGCASPNFFFAANIAADITAAYDAMFNQAPVVAHIAN